MSGTGTSRSVGFGSLVLLLVGLAVFLYLLSLFISGGIVGLFNPGKKLSVPDKTGKDIEVHLSYEKGSHGVTTFFVRTKNISGHVLGLVGRVRYWTMDGISRGEQSFILCLVRPWGPVPLNSYSTGYNTAVDSLVGPIQPGQEMTFEYDMARGDLDRIGSNAVTAGVFYYDMDPMQPRDPAISPPPMLAAWSNVLKAEPIQWGIDDKGLQVGLQIEGGVAVVQARNTSGEPIQLVKTPEWAAVDDLFRLCVLDYSGMNEALLPNKFVPWSREKTVVLNPGQTISCRYRLTLRDIQKIGKRLLVARVIPQRQNGPVAESNAVPLPAVQRFELYFTWPWVLIWPVIAFFSGTVLLWIRRRRHFGQ